MVEKRIQKFKVAYFYRKPGIGHYSVERLYNAIEASLPGNLVVETKVSTFSSRGIIRRVYNMLEAAFRQQDVNHVTGDVTFLSILLRKKRTITTILDCIPLDNSSGFKYWVMWLFWFWLPLKRSSRVVVISDATKLQLLRHCPGFAKKIHVIHCPLDPLFASAVSEEGLSKMDVAHRPRVLHVGSTPNKNLTRHIEALSGAHCTLVIVGNLDEAELSLLESAELNYELHSDVSGSDLPRLYASCDVLLFASTYEGFGLPILEAQAVGIPVVTSEILSMPEVAGPQGAVFVDPYSIDSIKAGVLSVLGNQELRRQLIEAGKSNIKRFSQERIGEAYGRLYNEVFSFGNDCER